jgi:3',5'-cyclic AMP phosphodiesterase CpdA
MPASYYSKTFELENGKKLLLVVMDSNPFIDDYYTEPEKYPSLAKQDTIAQKKWLVETLATEDKSVEWKIVVGHHPLYSGGKRKTDKNTLSFEDKFTNLFDQYKVDAYICGHEHDLQIIRPEGRYTTQLLSGASSEVRTSGKREGTIFAAAEPGFMAITIVDDKLIVQSVMATENNATLLNKTEIKK